MERRVLLTGASGFVGNAALPALTRAGWQVRGVTRARSHAERSPHARRAGVEWIVADLSEEEAALRALTGCDAALYLVHGMSEGANYQEREGAAAAAFARAAGRAGVRRVVYLGGVVPSDTASAHLQSRRVVGELLRAGPVPTIELRASMIVGHGSLSWLIVRDLAARLPVMVLPSWLRSRTQPVAIDDVVLALVRALDLPQTGSAWFDLPGPQILSGRQILDETARVMGLPLAPRIEVPLLTPRLSSLWVRFVTRARWQVAREVVVGLTHDLLARDDRFWSLVEHPQRLDFTEAARRALVEEQAEGPPPGAWGAVERMRRLVAARLAS